MLRRTGELVFRMGGGKEGCPRTGQEDLPCCCSSGVCSSRACTGITRHSPIFIPFQSLPQMAAILVTFDPCRDKKSWPEQLKGELIWAHTLRVQSVMVRKVWKKKWVTSCPQSAHYVLSCPCSLGQQPMEWCHPSLEWDFPTSINPI